MCSLLQCRYKFRYENKNQSETLKIGMEASANEIKDLRDAITNITPIVEGIKGSTVAEKEQELSNLSQKYDKVISGLKQTDKKE